MLTLAAVTPSALGEKLATAPAVRVVGPSQGVIDAIALAGLPVSASQIEMLAGSGNAMGNVSVRVVSISDRTDGTAKVKLRCQDNHECLPFYVLVHGVDHMKVTNAAIPATAVLNTTPPPNVIRGGDRAFLILETPDSRMSFPVICLQSGAPGQKIRVTSSDRKRSYDAEIVAAGLLKGSL
jgi:hypothetical protein